MQNGQCAALPVFCFFEENEKNLKQNRCTQYKYIERVWDIVMPEAVSIYALCGFVLE